MKQVDLTKGKVFQVLLALALPIMGSSLLQFTYNLVDMLWVGKLGSDAVASVGSSSFFIGLGYSINALIVIGTGIKVSHTVGKKQESETKAYIQAGMFLNALLGVSYALILVGFGKAFINFLALQNKGVEQGAYLYLVWSAPMLLFAFFNNMFSRIFGSLGNTKGALKISTVGIVTNIVLDPVFIYGLKLGVLGAALATLVANIIMFGMYLAIGKSLFSLKGRTVIQRAKVLEITRLGFPIAFQRILFTLVNIILAKLIGQFGSDAIAAQKIGLQIESVTYMVTGGLNGAVASFIGQNYGAQAYHRLKKGYQTALGIGVGYAILTATLFMCFPEFLAGLFVKEPTTIAIASSYLRIIAYSQIFNALEMVSNGYFTGTGKPKIPSYVSVIFTVLRIPMALVLTTYYGIDGVWWSITLSTLLKGMSLVLIYWMKESKRYETSSYE